MHAYKETYSLLIFNPALRRMTEKRKRVDLDINAKMDICKQVDSKISRKEIADRYGIDVSTIAKILKNSETIEKDFQMC